MNFFDFIFYNSVKLFVNIFFRLTYNLEILNAENIPKKDGILLVGNHSGWFDTLFLSCAVKRPLWFVTGEFILKAPVMGGLVKHLCVIPITKNDGTAGIEATVRKIKDGQVVCIFPEGQLTKTGELQRFRNGVAIIQKQTGVPVIPFCIKGSLESWSYKQKTPKFFKKITIKFGKDFVPEKEKDVDIANEIKDKVQALL